MDYGVAFDQDLRGKTHSDLKRWKEGAWMCNFSVLVTVSNPYDFNASNGWILDAAVKAIQIKL
jgi:membrane dipeptidase